MSEANDTFSVRMIGRNEWEDAMALCRSVFLEFEAPLYVKEGTESFLRFISDQTLHTVFINGGYPVCAAYYAGKMIGVAAVRSGPHLSLLFVDGRFQRKGVGTALVNYMREYLLSVNTGLGNEKMTVNASPVGLKFYLYMGFTPTDVELEKDGILYTPMELWL